MNRKSLVFGAALWVLVIAFVVGALFYNREKTQQSAQALERSRANLVQFYSPTVGKPDAKVHIVEFLDPACETCAQFYPPW